MSHPAASTSLALFFLLGLLGCTSDDGNGPTAAPVLRVEINSAGGDLDLNGYTVAIDGGAPHAVELNDVLFFEALEPGPHAVELDGLADNCVSAEGDIRSVTLSQSDTAVVAFDVSCTVNGVSVAVTTTGLDQDLFYNLIVDGISQPASFFAGVGVTVTRLAPGAHVFRLDGVGPNCRAEPEQQTVTVVAGSTIPIGFAVTCFAETAVLKVTVTTDGEDQDLTGYTVTVAGKTVKVKLNDVAHLSAIRIGGWSVGLQGVASNCTPDATARDIEVVAGGLVRDTLHLAFEVSCARAWELAFARSFQGSGTVGIRFARLDGSMVELATESFAKPAWSPDGQALAFSCAQVCILRLDGTTGTTLPTDYSTGGTSWSPDGTRLVFGSYTCPEYCYYNEEFEGLIVVRADDGSGPQKIPLPGEVTWASSPDWSPDGATIAFECRLASAEGGICIVRPDGSGFHRLRGGYTSSPAWSPDGSRIAFTGRMLDGSDLPAVWVMNADGTGARQVTGDGQGPDWTRDGQRLVFSVWHCEPDCDGSGLHWVRLDGNERARLTDGQDFYPAIRP